LVIWGRCADGLLSTADYRVLFAGSDRLDGVDALTGWKSVPLGADHHCDPATSTAEGKQPEPDEDGEDG
jgi:hypothetical protein